MNRTPEEKFILLFEAAKRAMLAAEVLLKRLTDDVRSLEQDIDQRLEIEDRAIPPLLSAVAFVDFAHRFGSVVDSLPLVSKKASEMRQLREALVAVEAARNHLQHMRGDLSSNAEIDYPVLGSLSWSNGDRSFTIFLSQPTKTNTYSMAYDMHNRCWVARHQYRVKDITIDLDGVLAGMQNAYKWIIGTVQFSDPEFGLLRWGKTQAFGYRIKLVPNSKTTPPAG